MNALYKVHLESEFSWVLISRYCLIRPDTLTAYLERTSHKLIIMPNCNKVI